MAPQTSLTDETGRVVFRGTQSPGGGSSPYARATQTLDPSQIATLDVPIEIVPSPGPGFVLVPLQVTLQTHGGSTPYGDPGGSRMAVGDAGTEVGTGGITLRDVLQSAAVVFSFDAAAAFGGGLVGQSGLVDKSLTILTTNPPSGGDTSLTVTVDYITVPVA